MNVDALPALKSQDEKVKMLGALVALSRAAREQQKILCGNFDKMQQARPSFGIPRQLTLDERGTGEA